MSRRAGDEVHPEVEEALENRWTVQQSPVGRLMFYVVLVMLGAVALARWTGHMELVTSNADLMAMVAGVAGIVWMRRMVRVGAIRIDRKGYWTVRRAEHPVGFHALLIANAAGFLGLFVMGLVHRIG